jgi:hypothetical protein
MLKKLNLFAEKSQYRQMNLPDKEKIQLATWKIEFSFEFYLTTTKKRNRLVYLKNAIYLRMKNKEIKLQINTTMSWKIYFFLNFT